MSAQHDPTATNAAACQACRAGATGYDHDAVRARRPKDFEAQVRAHVETIAKLRPLPNLGAENKPLTHVFAGVTLHPDAPRRAQRWLRAHPL